MRRFSSLTKSFWRSSSGCSWWIFKRFLLSSSFLLFFSSRLLASLARCFAYCGSMLRRLRFSSSYSSSFVRRKKIVYLISFGSSFSGSSEITLRTFGCCCSPLLLDVFEELFLVRTLLWISSRAFLTLYSSFFSPFLTCFVLVIDLQDEIVLELVVLSTFFPVPSGGSKLRIFITSLHHNMVKPIAARLGFLCLNQCIDEFRMVDKQHIRLAHAFNF